MSQADLGTVERWFTAVHLGEGVTRIDEPNVHEVLRGNIWHVRGAARDLVVDAGLGVASLRDELPELFANDPILVVTHAHLDHMGGAHEFGDRRAHATEPLGEPRGTSIRGPELAEQLGLDEELPELLLTARPAGFDPDGYRLRPAPATIRLVDGDAIDLGDRRFTVLHLPGHTPGSLCLLEEATGTLFSGDVIYDDVLLDGLHESDRGDYATSLRRLRGLPVRTVHAGHGASFDGERLRELIDAYLGD
ncbi:MBL fold metallo-hydrolase [Agromyces soli]|uniref:MBL fold metallo-hydrolase n=1 Tax=Agromyces soli TaxID=659012 RepID=A0ABY4AW28_9MICO|nr:MBL fold metallo-hydrolase [Agromyces soli]UOE27034.1 MBL fold metallo-hydrolase [Agromyces soli]